MVYPLEPGPQYLLRNYKTHRFATLWTIVRKDTTTLRFTDHDKDIVFGGNTYSSATAPDATAREMRAALGPSNLDLRAAFSTGLVTVSDLKKGLYDEADITEEVVDWYYPDVVGCLRKRVYYVDRVEFTDSTWTIQVMSVAGKLEKREGRVHDKYCPHVFGEGICYQGGAGVDLETASKKTALQTVAAVSSAHPKRIFTLTSPGITINQAYFKHGKVVWQSGANTGVTSPIREVTSGHTAWELWAPTPYDIAATDTFYAYVGCDKSWDSCIIYDNTVNFGGNPRMPNTTDSAPLQV